MAHADAVSLAPLSPRLVDFLHSLLVPFLWTYYTVLLFWEHPDHANVEEVGAAFLFEIFYVCRKIHRP